MNFMLVPERHDLKDLCALNVSISEIEGLFACLHLIQTHTQAYHKEIQQLLSLVF